MLSYACVLVVVVRFLVDTVHLVMREAFRVLPARSGTNSQRCDRKARANNWDVIHVHLSPSVTGLRYLVHGSGMQLCCVSHRSSSSPFRLDAFAPSNPRDRVIQTSVAKCPSTKLC